MANYMLSFVLADKIVNGQDHNARWDALYNCVKTFGTMWWTETTAFIAFTSDETIDEIASAVREEIAPAHDIVLIRSLDAKIARIIGPVTDQDIFKIMPYLKRA